jgi:hypothetical protein
MKPAFIPSENVAQELFTFMFISQQQKQISSAPVSIPQ